MSNSREPASVPPFPLEYRASGLLLHITSIPSPYGIGDLGSSAFSWVNRFPDAGQSWWQALPCIGSRARVFKMSMPSVP